jgi:hypothetical protein
VEGCRPVSRGFYLELVTCAEFITNDQLVEPGVETPGFALLLAK